MTSAGSAGLALQGSILSANSEKSRRRTLLDFLVRLAVDPQEFGAFIRHPRAAARKAGLTPREREILLSGDHNRLYAALAGDVQQPIASRTPGRRQSDRRSRTP